MKGLIFYISNNDFASLIQVLQQNNAEGISYFDIGGRGKLKRGEIDKNIEEYDAYRTGKKFIPEFVIRKRVEVVVNDSDSQKIVEDVKNQERFMVRYSFMMSTSLPIYLKILQIV